MQAFKSFINQASITNLFLIAAISKVLISSEVNYASIGLLALAVANFIHNRSWAGSTKSKEQDNINSKLNSDLKDISDRLEVFIKYSSNNHNALNSIKEQLIDQSKVVEEAKTMLSANKVANTFKRHQL